MLLELAMKLKLFFSGFFLLFALISGMNRGRGDKYVIRMDELVSPLDRHIRHIEKPVSAIRRLVRRKVRRPKSTNKSKRSTDGEGGEDRFVNNVPEFRSGGIQILTKNNLAECGSQKVPFDPPLHSTRIRNGTCTPYGAFPWTVQIQVCQDSDLILLILLDITAIIIAKSSHTVSII